MNEGFILKFKDYTWLVKGIEHPKGFVVAFPRYFGRRRVSDPLTVVRALNVIRRCDCAPEPVPLIPLSESEVLDPRDLLDGDREALELANVIGVKGAGLTGSRAVGIEGGDVDLIYYDNFERVIRALYELKEDGEIKPVRGKWDSLSERAVECKSKVSVLEGKWKDIKFSIRLVSPPRTPSRPTALGKIKVRGKIVRANAFVMPYTYVLDNGVVVESLRMQHSELPEGSTIEVSGTWEVSTRGERVHLGLGSRLDVIYCSSPKL